MGPSSALDHRRTPSFGDLNPSLGTPHRGRFSKGQAVHQRHRDQAHEGLEGWVEHGALHVVAMRVGSVQDHHVNPLLGTGLHDQHQRTDVRVEPGPHILNVEDHNIDPFELLGLWFAVCAVQRKHG